ncbi:MAG: MMPL family transporter [Spirochaetota bacterium]|nr:MMPL family transporter [Spirochaetota bacterium]
MLSNEHLFRYSWIKICLISLITGIFFVIALHHIDISTDITESLPKDDPVIADAGYIIKLHPMQDRIVINLNSQSDDIDLLIEAATFVEKRLINSGLFSNVGIGKTQQLIPELISYIINNLPVLFTASDIQNLIKPQLAPVKIYEALSENLSQLMHLKGIGQASFIEMDPLGFRNIVLKRLSCLAPSQDAQIYRGQLISSDRRNLLVVAEPKGSGADTEFSKGVTDLINSIAQDIERENSAKKSNLTLSPVGAYRAALDNETIAKSDTVRAVIFATLGITILLLLTFPRPLLGLLALLPAIFGTMMALFAYSLFNSSISMLAIGFGGAIISITVDHGIAYILFLDRPFTSSGRDASREVWSIGLLAALTTVGAFSSLFISGFQILAEIGQFAALGIAFSFIFVHTLFPMIFPSMPPAKREGSMPLQGFVNKLAIKGGRNKAIAAIIFAFILAFFAKPEFHVDLSSMNTVSKDTLLAEKLVADVWGDIFNKVNMMVEAEDVEELQQKWDILGSMLEKDSASSIISSSFIPSMIFPGDERLKQNLDAWRNFWNDERITNLKRNIKDASAKLGFSPFAFESFYKVIEKKEFSPVNVPERYFDLFGISKNRKDNGMIHFLNLSPGLTYDADRFYARYASTGLVKIFDANLFTERLGSLLSSTFIRMALILLISVIILLFIYFFDWQLTLIAMIPVIFALVCTLGTLRLIGHPLDIPGLMLSIVVIGMGIDYSLFITRSYQRYKDEHHTSVGLIRMAVFLTSASTIIGFGTLVMADHSLLQSAGITSLLGIFYSIVGAFTILPPILKRLFLIQSDKKIKFQRNDSYFSKVMRRYRHAEAYPRLFARFKIIFDPMFPRLSDFLNSPGLIIDIGCGYGVPAAWLLERFPDARIYCIEPDSERIRIASHALGIRGTVIQGKAPDIPSTPKHSDAALMLDIIHLIGDKELQLTLERLYNKLHPSGTLIIRTTIPSRKRFPWERGIENIKLKFKGITPIYRTYQEITDFINEAGFDIILSEPAALGREEVWFIAKGGKG